MSESEVERFSRKLNTDWGLRADAEKHQAGGNQNLTPLARIVGFASSHGFDFTTAEAREFAKAKGEELGVPVRDEDLDRTRGFPWAGGILGIITGDF